MPSNCFYKIDVIIWNNLVVLVKVCFIMCDDLVHILAIINEEQKNLLSYTGEDLQVKEYFLAGYRNQSLPHKTLWLPSFKIYTRFKTNIKYNIQVFLSKSLGCHKNHYRLKIFMEQTEFIIHSEMSKTWKLISSTYGIIKI